LVEDGSIVLGGYIGRRTGSALGASVIDGNVEATETSDGLVDEVLDFRFMPHIGAVTLHNLNPGNPPLDSWVISSA
jgi:hypothetical protein